mmetsp:Transcript_20238/g.30376  ORF Transcript_20238/g.30376 Transcript_20238/m.30376 type:complete len:108 (-) Transcript_20238:16-339(-)
MILQMEDCIDCLKYLHGNEFEYLFFFDHSSGHDRLRPDGLNANEMNKMYGGNGTKMRDTTIKNATYLGPHSPKLQIGDIQCMQFKDGDEGPFWMSEQERALNKYDRV